MLEAALALALVVAYWGYVVANVFRVKRETGKAPRLSPSTKEEKLLQLGWRIIVAGQVIQPLMLLVVREPWWLFRPMAAFDSLSFSVIGSLVVVVGLVGTRWCYIAMGRYWSMWIDQAQPSVLIQSGPYQWVRHPIYAFQIMISIGICFLVPTPFLIGIVALNAACVWTKASGEEHYLLNKHEETYSAYMLRTGRFFPRF